MIDLFPYSLGDSPSGETPHIPFFRLPVSDRLLRSPFSFRLEYLSPCRFSLNDQDMIQIWMLGYTSSLLSQREPLHQSIAIRRVLDLL